MSTLRLFTLCECGPWNNMTMITDLPRYPLFHCETLRGSVKNMKYLSDYGAFVELMAVCALAAAKERDGAITYGHPPQSSLQTPPPEFFFAAARGSLPTNLLEMKGLAGMRTCALLALFGLQVNRPDYMYDYLGKYHSLVALENLHDENNWPKDIGFVEIEVRRRLVCIPTPYLRIS